MCGHVYSVNHVRNSKELHAGVSAQPWLIIEKVYTGNMFHGV